MSFDQFIKERLYLHNVSPATVEWYRQSFKWLSTEAPDEAVLKEFVVRMVQHHLKASSCNNRIRAVNAYLKWSGSALRLPRLKEEQRVMPTFTLNQIGRIAAWKPRGYYQSRLQAVVLTLADTGCRIDEVLHLRWADCDLDNLLLTVRGKGRKDRKVPISFELRKRLFKWKQHNSHEIVFPCRRGHKLGRRDVLRGVKRLCKQLGFDPPERTLHAFRHTFAVNYLRRGGSVFHLQKVLGHSTLEMTRRYSNLLIDDLQEMHERVSVLNHPPNEGVLLRR